jgi:hypothetical protein
MLKNSLLSDRLNAIKKGQEPPKPHTEEVHLKKPVEEKAEMPLMRSSAWIPMIVEIYKLLEITGMSLLYGVGIQAISGTHWGFWGIFGVGILANQVINLISRLKLFR